jgi:hypothetical protein
VIDITPTILDITRVAVPTIYKGVPQIPLQGASTLSTIHDANAPGPRDTQYFEQSGNRAIWHNGWRAEALHKPGDKFADDKWELYDLNNDFSESNDLADRMPDRLKELQDLWWEEARKFNVLPLDGQGLMSGAVRQLAERHDLLGNRAHYTFYQGQGHIPSQVAPRFVNRSYAITAYVNRPAEGEGVLLALGDLNGGYSFFVKGGQLFFDQNSFGQHETLRSAEKVPEGKSVLRYEFAKTANFEGRAALFIDGRKVAEKEIHLPHAGFVLWSGLDIGRDAASVVTPMYADRGDFAFPAGGIQKVDVDLLADKPQATATR